MKSGNLKKDVLGFRKYKSIFFFTIIILLLFFLILFLILSCQSYRGLRSDDVEFKSGKIKVAATIYPLFDLVRNVGDGRVDVIYIIRPGESPHVFEFTPEQAKKLESVSIIFKIGLGLDDWIDEGVGNLGKDIKIVNVNENIDLIDSNPHIWLSPENAMTMIDNINKHLADIDPGNKSFYDNNSKKYIERLEVLDEKIRNETSTFNRQKFIAFHQAWVYFARDYGLEQISSIEPFPGKEPTPEYIVKLQKLIEDNNIKSIFIEPQMSTQVVNFLAEDMNLEIYTLDPLGGVEGRKTYIDLMLYNLKQFKKALSS